MRSLLYLICITLITLNSSLSCMKRAHKKMTLEFLSSPQKVSSESQPCTWHSLPPEIQQYVIVYNSMKNVIRLVCKAYHQWFCWDNKERLLKQFPDMRFHGYAWQGIMPLLCAKDKIDTIKKICDHQSKSKKWINKENMLGKVLLQYANSSEMRTALVSSGADLETFFERAKTMTETPLETAILLDDIQTVKLYLQDACFANQINAENNIHKITPLWPACILKRYKIAQLLINNGAKPQIIWDNNTLLHKVAAYACDSFMKLLLNNTTQSIINHRNNDGETPLMVAVSSKYGNSDTIELLLGHGADANMLDQEHNAPAVWLAIYYHQSIETIKALLLKISPDNINHVATKAPRCALSTAVRDNNYELVTLLINHGAQINTFADPQPRYTPFKDAIRLCNLPMVEHLLTQATSEITTNHTIIPDMITYTNKILAQTGFTEKQQATLILILNKLRSL